MTRAFALADGEILIDPAPQPDQFQTSAVDITLEVINHGPFHLKLVPRRTRICQFIFERLEAMPETEITTGFQGQRNPIGGKT